MITNTEYPHLTDEIKDDDLSIVNENKTAIMNFLSQGPFSNKDKITELHNAGHKEITKAFDKLREVAKETGFSEALLKKKGMPTDGPTKLVAFVYYAGLGPKDTPDSKTKDL